MENNKQSVGLTVIIQLGGPNDEQGNLSDIAIARCEKTIQLAEQFPTAKILCTGGHSEHFNQSAFNHSELTQSYLQRKGISKERFLPSALSRFTIEDATLSAPILNNLKVDNLLLVTSGFHMNRALAIFSHIFPTYTITPEPAVNAVSAIRLIELEQHESKAITRDKQTLASM